MKSPSANQPGYPQIAVVTVCRNALEDLKVTVASVRAQLYPALMHVVVDGASSDGTPEFLRAHAGCFHALLSESDAGIYDAMNKAISLCPHADWVVFLNAGDAFAAPGVLADAASLLKPDIDLVFGSVIIRSTNGRRRVVAARPGARTGMPGCHQSSLVRGDLMRRLRFDPTYAVGADFDFFLRATRSARRLAFHPGVIAEVAPEGFSAANEDLLQRDYTRTIERHLGRPNAVWWLCKRKVRLALLRGRDLLRRIGIP